MLKKLFNEIWHTEETLETDKNGYVEFRGFYGQYDAPTHANITSHGKFGVFF